MKNRNILIIDGYNIINAWRDVFDPEKEPLEDLRDRLIQIMSNYSGHKDLKVIIVFDAYKVESKTANIEIRDNVKVIFTKEKEIADQYIERYVHENAKYNTIWVATSDYLEQTIILKGGANRISARELKQEVLISKKEEQNKSVNNNKESLEDSLDKETRNKFEDMRRGK